MRTALDITLLSRMGRLDAIPDGTPLVNSEGVANRWEASSQSPSIWSRTGLEGFYINADGHMGQAALAYIYASLSGASEPSGAYWKFQQGRGGLIVKFRCYNMDLSIRGFWCAYDRTEAGLGNLLNDKENTPLNRAGAIVAIIEDKIRRMRESP